MTALTYGKECVQMWSNGEAGRTCLYALRNINTGDTIDVSYDFASLKRAVLLGVTVAGATVAANTGNVVTIPAGVANDAAYLLAFGVHS